MGSVNNWHLKMYNSEFARSSIGSRRFTELAKKQVDFLDSVLKLQRDSQILDVPCGTGRHSVLLAKRGYKVTGVDISRDCLKIAKTNSQSVYDEGSDITEETFCPEAYENLNPEDHELSYKESKRQMEVGFLK